MWPIKRNHPRHELHVFKGVLADGCFAVVRVCYPNSSPRPVLVTEVAIKDYGDHVLNAAKFTEVVSGFLEQSSADVFVYIECEPAELGLEDP
jgi:hypothetical protein